MTRSVDNDGIWDEEVARTGVRVRTLVEPSQEYLDRQEQARLADEAREAAEEQARLDAEAARAAALDAISRASTIAQLRTALLDYLQEA